MFARCIRVTKQGDVKKDTARATGWKVSFRVFGAWELGGLLLLALGADLLGLCFDLVWYISIEG